MKQIKITDGSTVLGAVLNDTVAAWDFEKRLPLSLSGYDSGMDYCCNAASGRYDPTQTQTGGKTEISALAADGLHCCMAEKNNQKNITI